MSEPIAEPAPEPAPEPRPEIAPDDPIRNIVRPADPAEPAAHARSVLAVPGNQRGQVSNVRRRQPPTSRTTCPRNLQHKVTTQRVSQSQDR